MSHPIAATALVLATAAWLNTSGGGGRIWGVFGASNQLLAALTLLVILLVLMRAGKSVGLIWPPMLLMLVTSLWALFRLLSMHWATRWPLVVATAVLIVLAFVLGGLALISILNERSAPRHG